MLSLLLRHHTFCMIASISLIECLPVLKNWLHFLKTQKPRRLYRLRGKIYLFF